MRSTARTRVPHGTPASGFNGALPPVRTGPLAPDQNGTRPPGDNKTLPAGGDKTPSAADQRTRRTRRAPVPASFAALHAGAGTLVLDRYRLVAQLGAGAFATVWLAVDERLAREVAIKVIPQRRVIKARFQREAWAAARLSHPGVVTLYEAAADRDAAYLVSELVRGSTLEAALAEGRLSDRTIIAIGISLCDVLAHAHALGIIHRDVKPSNILIPEEEASVGPPAKLTDFGVAHAVGGDSLTATGEVVGTAAYMAPEQAAGREVRPTADLYALALVLYEGLTGINPLDSITALQRGSRLGLYLPPLRRQRRDLPRELGHGIDLALRPRPAERGTIGELRGALETSLNAVSDEAGVVANPWRLFPRRAAHEERTLTAGWPVAHAMASAPEPSGGPQRAAPERHDQPVTARFRQRREEGDRPNERAERARNPLGLGARAGGAAAGAVLAGWLVAHMLTPAPLAPAAAALGAAALMLVVPRLGFVAMTAALMIVAIPQGHAGDALLVGFGAAVAILVAPGGRPPWPLGVGAPALGALGLAGAWPAVAARATTPRRRAILGFTGWVWLALAGPLAGASLYVQVPPGGPPRGVWSGSPYEVAHHVLGALLRSGALAGAPVWGLAAAVLPVLLTRRSLARDAALVAAWAVLLAVFTELAISATNVGSGSATVHTVLVGTIVAGVVALGPSIAASGLLTRRPQRRRHRSRRPGRGSERSTRKAQRTVPGGYTEAGVP